MGTTVRATCPDPPLGGGCGDVRLKASDMVVRVCIETQEGSYRFRCPSCKLIILKQADNRIVSLLETSGVDREDWHLPQELWEPHPDGDPISLDDVLAMHEFLEAGGWIGDDYP